ncbi:MAG: magnesium transporter [Clostridia bacterium]|nr:magnesium transporter [Clostridia bacterium]
MEPKTLYEIILELFQARKPAALKAELSEHEPADIAAALLDLWDDGEIREDTLPIIFRTMPKALAAEVFAEMDTDLNEALIRSFSDKELKAVMSELFIDDAVDIIEEMPANVVKRMLQSVDSDTRAIINKILDYPDDSAGSIMTTEYVALRPTMTVSDAFARIRKTGVDKETIYTCYVIDRDRHLIGLVTAKELLLADSEAIVGDIMEDNVISAHTLDDREEVANMLSHYDFLALPIVDKEDRLVGIVTVDDAIDVLQEEVTEDIELMSAITPSDRSYTRTGVWEIFLNRIPWLLILMVSATFTGIIISSYETALAAQVALTAFIPMLMSTAGNSGSQASVTVLRSISLGELEFSDLFKVIFKEFRVSLLCAVALAVGSFIKIWLVDYLLMGNKDITLPVIAVICLTLAVTVILSKLIGCVLPMLAKKIGLDPAVMASPFITTIVDTLTLFIYFQFATAILAI